tara:strand:+ start:12202 stop:13134 length:933 start_codon:yes stop_codon:yes gene_type:complete
VAGKKIPKQLFLFLGLSTLIWLLITLSKEYRASLTFGVRYINVPQNRLMLGDNNNSLTMSVNANGFKILRTRIQNSILELDASLMQQDSKGRFYLLVSKQQPLLQEQLLSDVFIQSIRTDSIFLNLDVLASKKIAVRPNVKVNYHVGYGLTDEVTVNPDSILVSGSKKQLDTMQFLDHKPLILSDVKANFRQEVELLIQNPKGLKLSQEKVVIEGKVDKFTEGSVKVPFEVINVPKDVKITTLSAEVSVVFVIGLSDFNQIMPLSFKVECDYDYSKSKNLTYLIPRISKKPKTVKSVKIVPQTIDFLIQK